MINLVIAGSRTIRDKQRLIDALEKHIFPIYGRDIEIISGGALGVDTLAKEYADEHNLTYHECKPIYKFPGDCAAPLRRNCDMAQMGDVLLAIWDQKSTGTGHMITQMKKVQKPYFIA